jgi:hypothetical protein
VEHLRPRVGELLIDAVAQGVGRVPVPPGAEADTYWGDRAQVADGLVVLFVATVDDGRSSGRSSSTSTPTEPAPPRNVSKLLVLSTARRRASAGAHGARQRVADERGRWLFTLDTATPEAERLYSRMGWSRSGSIPDYAMNPDRSLTPTTFFWKDLRRSSAS